MEFNPNWRFCST